MKAMILTHIQELSETSEPLILADIPDPIPDDHEIMINVSACGVCHTELDEIEGRTPPSFFPMVPGHQVVGHVSRLGPGASKFNTGDRVGVAWIFSACGKCSYCKSGNENLCPEFKATGRDAFGGYAEKMKIHEDFALSIPAPFTDEEAAPLLCAGAIGLRSVRLAHPLSADLPKWGEGHSVGLTGFGASGHLVLKMILHLWPEVKVFVFARSAAEQSFACELGAAWAGDTIDDPPEKMDAIIDTTPVWKPVVEALKHLKPGGRLVINAIRKENIDKDYLLHLDYPEDLWMEKEIKSVANVTTTDVMDFLQIASDIPIKPEVQLYSLEDANKALLELKHREIRGAKVLKIA